MDLKELLARANAKAPIRESRQSIKEENLFDELDTFIDNTAVNSTEPTFNTGLSKDGQQLQVGDPVVGIHRGQNLSGQVIAIQGDMVTVEWKDHTTSNVKASQLELTDVDDDYEEQTMYIESAEQPYMGFDREAFNEDTDLDSLLRGRPGQSSFNYGNISDDF